MLIQKIGETIYLETHSEVGGWQPQPLYKCTDPVLQDGNMTDSTAMTGD